MARLAAMPLNLPWLTAALYKCALTCPPEFLIKHISKFVTYSDVESLKEGKTNHQKALACEAVLKEFRDRHREWLQQAPSEKATGILTKLDSQAARILLNKRCKFASYEALTSALAAEMGASGVSPGLESSPQDTAGGGVFVSCVGEAATALDQLRDAGVLPGSWVQCTKDIEGCKAGDVGQVLHLTEQEMEWQPRCGQQAASGSS